MTEISYVPSLTDPRSVEVDGEVVPRDDVVADVQVDTDTGDLADALRARDLEQQAEDSVMTPVDQRRRELEAEGIPPHRINAILRRKFGVRAVYGTVSTLPTSPIDGNNVARTYRDARSAAANDYE